MEKKTLRKDIGENKEFDAESYGGIHPDIDEIIEFFTEAKDAGATHVDWYAWCDRDGDGRYCQAQPFCEYEETEEQAETRIKDEEDLLERQMAEVEQKEKGLYERLKLKFG